MHTVTKVLIVLAALSSQLAFAGQPSIADEDVGVEASSKPKAPDTVLKFHPVATIGGLMLGALGPVTTWTLPVELEHAVAPNVSLYAMAAPMLLTFGTSTIGGLALNGGVRLYFSGHAPDGLWLGGQVMGSLFSNTCSPPPSIDLQPQLGYQWVTKSGFTIGVGLGLSAVALATGQAPVTFVVPVGFTW
jgi:hypothetical protein